MNTVSELMRQALAHHGRGALDDALRLYNEVLAREPDHADALHLSGVVAHQQGRNQEAVALITRAIEMRPRAPAWRNNLGLALTALGQWREAEDAYREALGLAPEFVDALLNLGNLRAAQGFSADAVTSLEKAVALGADSAEVYYKLGYLRAVLGDWAQAVSCYRRALEREGDHLGAQHGLLECLDRLPADADAALLESVLMPLLRGKSINPRVLGHAAARLLERKHALGAQDASNRRSQDMGDHLLDDGVARRYLRRTVNVSASIERLLTRCRAGWLQARGDGIALARSRWDAVAAVAEQCFLNEFAWAVTPEEQRALGVLEQRIVDALAPAQSAQTPADPALLSDLLVYACYRPLWRMNRAAHLRALAGAAWPDVVGEMLRVSLHEPLWEQDAKSRIACGAAIRDGTSKSVQLQYEENPYPRWQALTRAGQQSIEERLQRWCPGYAPPAELRGRLRVLIAGCGTGMDAVDTALHLQDADVTAIDLSRASLAYAMRKAGEYALENIRFRQEDILEIVAGAEPFHVINCTGVLHHMRDPGAGLHRLVRLLMPGGLIRLALYSKLAREPLMQAREAIRAMGFGGGEDEIRSFRQRVLEEGARGPLAELMGSTDFFSLSECRDLLFHVQETQVTLPEISSLLESQGLEFLGFELTIPEVAQGFRREYPRAALTDLGAWDAYEQQHPHSFRAMYQFWCRKTDDAQLR